MGSTAFSTWGTVLYPAPGRDDSWARWDTRYSNPQGLNLTRSTHHNLNNIKPHHSIKEVTSAAHTRPFPQQELDQEVRVKVMGPRRVPSAAAAAAALLPRSTPRGTHTRGHHSASLTPASRTILNKSPQCYLWWTLSMLYTTSKTITTDSGFHQARH